MSMRKPARGSRRAPKLLADIGGTNARFGLETAPGVVEAISVLQCNAYETLTLALQAYLSSVPAIAAGATDVKVGAIAIAGPVEGDEVRMTNHHWVFSMRALRLEFELDTLLLVNDFKAMAMSIPFLGEADKHQVGGGTAQERGVIGLVGPGTGFGVSALVCARGEWLALETEGGHVTFAPADELEYRILRFAWTEYPHVSVERLLSGIGLNIVYRALAEFAGAKPEELSVPEIMRRAITQECRICARTVESFCKMLGTAAANVALTIGATGGIYIGGGIVPRLGERFIQSGFRRRFEDGGRFSAYLVKIPTVVITAEYPTFQGLSAKLAGRCL